MSSLLNWIIFCLIMCLYLVDYQGLYSNPCLKTCNSLYFKVYLNQ
nr:MAG TPA: hypothetical protein [Caudoviricetes sp.]